MNWLFRSIPIASLVFFRIAFGILGFVDVLGTWLYYHLEKNSFDPDRFQFRYYGFEWAAPLAEPWMSLFFLLMLLLAVLIVLGAWYRPATILFFLGFTYLFLLEKANYLNHAYLFCWICFIMIFLPVQRSFSLAVWRKPNLYRPTVPYWCLFLLQFLIGVVYFFGGVAKLNGDWLRGVPLISWLRYKSDLPVIGPLLGWEPTAWFMAYGGVFLDLLIVPLLLYRRTRPFAFAMAVFFHISNTLIFNIGIFPFLSLSLTALYFSPDFPLRGIDWLSMRWAWVKRLRDRWAARMEQGAGLTKPRIWQEREKFKPWIKAAVITLVAVHLLLPLRHHLFPGDVAWTEEGHRYSWRMMLRSKQGSGHFIVKNLRTGEEENVSPANHLSNKQFRKLYTHPDMILQFAHFLEKNHLEKGDSVAVYADVRVKLNDGDYFHIVDPSVDLTKETWHFFKHSDWILEPGEEK